MPALKDAPEMMDVGCFYGKLEAYSARTRFIEHLFGRGPAKLLLRCRRSRRCTRDAQPFLRAQFPLPVDVFPHPLFA
eukprot:1563028-Rhodomonas_salina.2